MTQDKLAPVVESFRVVFPELIKQHRNFLLSVLKCLVSISQFVYHQVSDVTKALCSTTNIYILIYFE